VPERVTAVFDRSVAARIEGKLDDLRWRGWQVRHPVLRRTRAMRLGRGAQIILAGAGRIELGDGVLARPDLTIAARGTVRIGDGVFLGRGVNIACYAEVSIGAHTRLAERVSIHDANHVMEPLSDLAGRAGEMVLDPVHIGQRVWLAANVVVLPGVTIGDDTVVAASSVVSESLPAGVLAVGVPARARPLSPGSDPMPERTNGPAPALTVGVLEPGRVNSGIRRYGEVVSEGLRAHDHLAVTELPRAMGSRGWRGIREALALVRALRGLDVVILPYTRYQVVSPTATRLLQLLILHLGLRRRTVTVLHDVYAPGSPRHTEWWALCLVLLLSGRTVIHSEHERRQILSVPFAGRAQLVPHFVAERPPRDRARARAELGVDPERWIVGIVGWMNPRKNYELAIEALTRTGAEVELWFVGGVGLGQEGYVRTLEELARARGVGERLRRTGTLSEEDLERHLAALDVGLCPYHRISASGSLSTLIGARRPVIATDV
jgi:acetyltransferase-like isoleucine patch superfamily enzyme/glycosyltransferase involved in cell wall biosynthesis